MNAARHRQAVVICVSDRTNRRPYHETFRFEYGHSPDLSESVALTRKANRAEYSARMHRVVEYIDRHLDQELGLKALAGDECRLCCRHSKRLTDRSWPFEARPCDALPGFLFADVIKFGVSQLGNINE